MTLSANAERLLDVYRIGGGTPSKPRRSITARQLRDVCQAAELAPAVLAIERFVEQGGSRYSYEDFDVLNFACTELYRTGFRFPDCED